MKRAHAALLMYKQAMDMEDDGDLDSVSMEQKSEETWSIARQEAAMELRELFDEFDWCLRVLEKLECKRSVSSLTMRKFCSMLSRELSTSFSTSDAFTGTMASEANEETMSREESADAVATSVENMKTEFRKDTPQERLDGFRPYLSQNTNRGHLSAQSTASSQICDYIYGTFVEDDEITELELATNNTGNDSKRLNRKAQTSQIPSDEYSCCETNSQSKTVQSEECLKEKSDIPKYLISLWNEAGSTFDKQNVLDFIQSYQDSYSPDLFNLHTLSCCHTLSTFGLYTLMKRDILNKLLISTRKMHRCLTRVEALYNQTAPFHNSIHATDVMVSMDYLLRLNGLETSFTDLEIFATLFACAVHDIDHPAVTNQFLINTNDELALLYNDNSVLENHHLYVIFNLMHKEPDCDITDSFTAQQRALFRKMIISLVLSTDMSKHMNLLADLKTTLESQRAAGFNEFQLDNYSSRIQILQCLVHASDLSNPTKPLPLYQQWVDRITEEMFQQGDREREAGLEISPMCDRRTACVKANQIGFIDYVVYPLWETISELLQPEALFLLEAIQANRDWCTSTKVTKPVS
ncbi:unnamed protein product [Dicrocoelium dendriticum]|nr:unnamed protein product [Dicrocoelium dendriticum]